MKSLRQVIRKLILESQGMDQMDVWDVADADLLKRHSGHYAKDVFRRRADRDWLNSLTYIHTSPIDSIDSWLSRNSTKDELSCLINGEEWTGQEELYVNDFVGNFHGNGTRIGLIIKGWTTWASNWNANTGFTGTLKRNFGEKPHSGINKAPGKAYDRIKGRMGEMVPQMELDRVLMDEEDWENKEMLFMDEKGREAKNNEALLDNWTIAGVCMFVTDHTDAHPELLSDEYNKKVQKAFKSIKRKFPKAEIVKCVLD